MLIYNIPLYRSRELLQPEDRINILSNGSLVIRTLEPGDAGNYSCRAINEWGSQDQITIELHVLGKLMFSISLECSVPKQ